MLQGLGISLKSKQNCGWEGRNNRQREKGTTQGCLEFTADQSKRGRGNAKQELKMLQFKGFETIIHLSINSLNRQFVYLPRLERVPNEPQIYGARRANVNLMSEPIQFRSGWFGQRAKPLAQ